MTVYFSEHDLEPHPSEPAAIVGAEPDLPVDWCDGDGVKLKVELSRPLALYELRELPNLSRWFLISDTEAEVRLPLVDVNTLARLQSQLESLYKKATQRRADALQGRAQIDRIIATWEFQ